MTTEQDRQAFQAGASRAMADKCGAGQERWFYIGKCTQCGTINAGAIADKEDTAAVKDMIDSGLAVSRIKAVTVDLRRCEHCGKPRSSAPTASKETAGKDIINALTTLELTADTVFERIKNDLERGLTNDARRHLNFVDKLTAHAASAVPAAPASAGQELGEGLAEKLYEIFIDAFSGSHKKPMQRAVDDGMQAVADYVRHLVERG